MQLKLTPVITALCLLGLASMPAFAADNSDATSEQQLIEKLSKQTAALQKEVASLQAQVKTLKSEHTHIVKHAKRSEAAQAQPAAAVAPQGHVKQVVPVQALGDEPVYLGGTPIVIGPFLGEHAAFDASDLIIYSSTSVGLDLRLLQQRNKIYNFYKQYGLPAPSSPSVDVSGGIEAQYINSRPYTGSKTSNVDLTRGELDLLANVNNWTSGFMAFAYDNAPPATGRVASNSRVFLDRGFINIGNLSQTPFYGTIGQFYVPFGRYSDYMISDPVTKTLARTKARAALLGYDQTWGASELNLSTYTFKGDSTTSSTNNKLNQLGFDANYTITQPKWNGSLGSGIISNIADSIGIQNNGGSTGFTGFGGSGFSETLSRRVPAYDVHGSLGVGPYSLVAEYLSAIHEFSPDNMTYNNHGAEPSALNLEAAYSFPIFDKPSALAVGYGMTRDALALLLPEQRYIATLTTSIWKDTIEQLEFRHDINYPGSATATGQGVSISNNGQGHTSDTVTFQVGVYF